MTGKFRHPKDDGRATFLRRTLVLGSLQTAVVAALVTRLYQLQVLSTDVYQARANDNRISLELLPPQRGRIRDRDGTPLAGNLPNYQARLVPAQAGDIDTLMDRLSGIVPLTPAERTRIRNSVRRWPNRHQPLVFLDNLGWKAFSAISLRLAQFDGVDVLDSLVRVYTDGQIYGHLIGYVGTANGSQIGQAQEQEQQLLRLPGFRIGQKGLEKALETTLRGRAGVTIHETDARGRLVRELKRLPSVPGGDVVLSLDPALHRYVHDRTRAQMAMAVVMDVRSGEILASASHPGFDPNLFSRGISRENWNRLLRHPGKPLVNRAFSGIYPPGSTFKMISVLAGLGRGGITAGTTFYCSGRLKFGGRYFHCHKRSGHGWLDLAGAFEQSCDIYFYELAKLTGIGALSSYARLLGVGEPVDFELGSEAARGTMPDPAWKLRHSGEPWYDGETLNVVIGQGQVSMTALQLCLVTARIANGGYRIDPTLRRTGPGADRSPGPSPALRNVPRLAGIPDAHLELLREGMQLVVSGRHGTARKAQIPEPDFRMAGKTGTSQVRSITRLQRLQGLPREEDIQRRFRDHAMFVGYAPRDDPRYACCVIVEQGGSGAQVAAPVAADILRAAQFLEHHGVLPPDST